MLMKVLKKSIEVEVRSFITKDQYTRLIKYLKKVGEYLGRDEQITYYFSGRHDLRIQKNSKGVKLWLKTGKMHDTGRKEIEVRASREDFEKLKEILLLLGYKIEIQWFRVRHQFAWRRVIVSVDYTRGYGYILEIEKMTDENNKEKAGLLVAERMAELGIPLTPRSEFEKQFKYYKKHWRSLV